MDTVGLLGRRLRARRSELGLTLAAVAFEAGLSVPYVANLEKGRGNPTLDVIDALASALDVTIAALLETGEPSAAPDVVFADLPDAITRYARGRTFAGLTETLAVASGTPSAEMRAALLRALATIPRPRGREFAVRDCQRVLDAVALIVLDPERA